MRPGTLGARVVYFISLALPAKRDVRMRVVFFTIVGASTLALVFILWGFGALDRYERNSIDARFSIRGTRHAPAQVVVVAIDDVTFDELTYRGQAVQWPFPRSIHAKLLDRIAAGHPKAIAFDVQFTE